MHKKHCLFIVEIKNKEHIMGRKKLDTMDYISNENLRNIAYSKRRKGLVKKAMELSKLCGVKV